jgi:hypothetical protein
MRPVGSRKDHRFDSDGQIKASRGRANNEEAALIHEQLEEREDLDIEESEL